MNRSRYRTIPTSPICLFSASLRLRPASSRPRGHRAEVRGADRHRSTAHEHRRAGQLSRCRPCSPWTFFVAWPTGGRDRSSCTPSVPTIRLACFERTREFGSSAIRLGTRRSRVRGAAARSGMGADARRSKRSPRGTGSGGPEAAPASASPSASPRRCRAPNPPCWPTSSSSSAPARRRPGRPPGDRVAPRRRRPPGSGRSRVAHRRWKMAGPLDLTDRTHYAPLFNALSQYDRAALVDADGCVVVVGILLSLRARKHDDAATSARSAAPVTRRRCGSPPTCTNTMMFVATLDGALTVAARRIDASTPSSRPPGLVVRPRA